MCCFIYGWLKYCDDSGDRSGKSSIQKVVFHKVSPNETLFLESTNKIVKDGKKTSVPAPLLPPPPPPPQTTTCTHHTHTHTHTHTQHSTYCTCFINTSFLWYTSPSKADNNLQCVEVSCIMYYIFIILIVMYVRRSLWSQVEHHNFCLLCTWISSLWCMHDAINNL